MTHDSNLIVYHTFFNSYTSLILQVKAMVEGRDRRPELGFKLAMELKNAENENKRGKRQI